MAEPDLVVRLREVLTINLAGDLLGAARVIRRMMVERAEAANEIEALRERVAALDALEKAMRKGAGDG